jgi:Kef-type K+ transport system membrane component KefB
MTAGIAIFALLPVAGLSITSRQFARTRDWKLSAISISVLVIIAIGICVGVFLGKTSH